MSHYTLEDLLARWRREDLTAEQMIGQMLQVLHEHERRIRTVESRELAAHDRGAARAEAQPA